jgi:hypothetical protein
MTGETDLSVLIKNMTPELNPGVYAFCVVNEINPLDLTSAIGWFREKEGITLILPKQQADALGLQYSFIASWITLNVHSSLEAKGLTAAFSSALTKAEISCNVLAAYHHDHIFVPVDDAEKAMKALRHLAGNPQESWGV